jgi:hypothetical protein
MANASKLRIVFGAVALAFAVAIWLIYSAFVSTVATKRSPDGRHVAKLVRVQGIDVIFRERGPAMPSPALWERRHYRRFFY